MRISELYLWPSLYCVVEGVSTFVNSAARNSLILAKRLQTCFLPIADLPYKGIEGAIPPLNGERISLLVRAPYSFLSHLVVRIHHYVFGPKIMLGLRGCIVGHCVTSSVHPQEGVSYCGKPITEVANWKPEAVIYLLYHGRPPKNEEELESFFDKEIRPSASLSNQQKKQIQNLSKKLDPMKMLATALFICAEERAGNYREDCLAIIAKAPHVAAAVISHHGGWELQPSDPHQLGYIESFAQMLNAPGADLVTLTEAFRLTNILQYAHGGGSLSECTGSFVASGREDMYGSVAAAMLGLEGDSHGGASLVAFKFVQSAVEALGENPTEADVEGWIRKKLQQKERIPGAGHAVLRREDPRATIMYQVVQKQFPNHPLVKMALLLRTVVPRVLKENPKNTDPHMNVDTISGTFLYVSGFPYPEYYPVLFGMARVVGAAIQIAYERCEAHTPLTRPTYLYQQRKFA